MARNPKVTKKKTHDRRPKPTAGGGRPRRGKPKVCLFCTEHATWVDYKDVGLLRRFVNERGRIKARGATGTCAQHQRDVATAIKTARELALLPYSVRTAGTEGRGGRGGDRRGGPRPAATGEGSESGPAPAEGAEQAEGGAEGTEEVSESADEASEPSVATPA